MTLNDSVPVLEIRDLMVRAQLLISPLTRQAMRGDFNPEETRSIYVVVNLIEDTLDVLEFLIGGEHAADED